MVWESGTTVLIILQVAVQFSGPFIEEAVFSPLYILASFAIDYMTM